MPGSPSTLPAPELPPGNRLALVISTTTYVDPAIRQLRAPARDATDLGELLGDPDVGGFVVTSLVDASAQDVRLAMEEFLADRLPGDLLLVYLSCHGLVDARRRLYFAATDTRKDRLAATGVEAQWVLDQFDDCRAKQQVVILDCCFSGAFALGAKGDDGLGLGERFQGHGRGRVVLTASRASEYSFEGDPLPGSSMPGSVFTTALMEGIRSGVADADQDGLISIDDAYAYAFDQVRASDAEQTPQRWLYGAEGSILLARSPAGVRITPAPLPDDLQDALRSPHPAIRIGAVNAVGEWLTDEDPAKSLAARMALGDVADKDVPRVATEARTLLDTAAAQTPAHDRGRAGSAVGSQPRGASASSAVASRRAVWWRRPEVLAVAGLCAAAAVVAAGFLLRDHQLKPPAPSPAAGTLAFASPWRLLVDAGDARGSCHVVLKSADGKTVFDRKNIYGASQFQRQTGGTFRYTTNDRDCKVFGYPGPGNDPVPSTLFVCCQGDTNAFPTTHSPVAEVVDFNGSSDCKLVLHDAQRGNVLDDHVVEEAGDHTWRLNTSGASAAYLADLTCSVRIHPG